MAIQDVVQQLVSSVASNPEMLTNLMEHPYSTIGNLTGNENVSKEEASQVVAATSALASGQAVDFSGLASLASGLLSQNGGSVHELANALLGSGSNKGVNLANGINADVLSNMASAVDLSDGLGLDDVAGALGALFGKK